MTAVCRSPSNQARSVSDLFRTQQNVYTISPTPIDPYCDSVVRCCFRSINSHQGSSCCNGILIYRSLLFEACWQLVLFWQFRRAYRIWSFFRLLDCLLIIRNCIYYRDTPARKCRVFHVCRYERLNWWAKFPI